ncbi:MAG: hypothetical protein J4415_00400 [Candidatus Diapherotrites archaeon]|uniref:Uncharacterized protein n=1 Tax=Candidatus Iainarchaeum sp. TaxID=3101447 RepID=A0A8T4KVC3_9ARCH|nr:hypothetical protein [Candidatus Diapherotrites archaeon]
MKTTIILRDDLYGLLTATFGKRNMSKTINEILFETLRECAHLQESTRTDSDDRV